MSDVISLYFKEIEKTPLLTADEERELARRIKKDFPDTPLVIGGPQLCSAPEKTMRDGPYDLGVLGEGEETMLELAKAIAGGERDLSRIRGLIRRGTGGLIFNEPRPYIEDLDILPFPARHLYPPLDRYRPVPASYIKKPVGLMISSRGCPYQCIFCDRKVFGNRFRAHSSRYVVDEMEELIKKYGAKEIRFMDDTFTLDIKRVDAICDEIFKRKIKAPWTCLTRVNTVNLDILKKMKRAGCWQVIYGIESGDQRMLDIIKKSVTVEQNELGVRLAKKAGLNVRATFVFGLPGETLETIRRTVEFAKRADLDVVNFFTVILFPGNELFSMAKKEGIKHRCPICIKSKQSLEKHFVMSDIHKKRRSITLGGARRFVAECDAHRPRAPSRLAPRTGLGAIY